jgi:Family of unknown function (DUF5421)
MSVPPSGRRSTDTSPTKGRPDADEKSTDKPFQLPQRKEGAEEKKEEPKKKGLFDLTTEETMVQPRQQNVQPDVKMGDQTTEVEIKKTTGVEAKTEVAQIGQLIQNMVESMRVGQVDGKDFATVELKREAEMPRAFVGSHLTISYEANGISIHFDNFMTPQQQNSAITLIEKNKEQLMNMMQALNAKNIQVRELSIGTHTIALPRIEPLPPPFQPPPSAEAETRQQQRRQDQGREGGEERGGPR